MLKIGVLVSGGGTNLQMIIDNCKNGGIDGKIVSVVSSNPNAYALTRAADNGIPSHWFKRKNFPSQTDFENAIIEVFDNAGAELIVTAGFMVILSEGFTRHYKGRMINVHPSLIPSFCGKGFYGLKVHEAALNKGVKITGATVHFVDEGCDTGPIILQKAVEVRSGDTPEILQKRVMEEAEWIILPKAIQMIAKGEI